MWFVQIQGLMIPSRQGEFEVTTWTEKNKTYIRLQNDPEQPASIVVQAILRGEVFEPSLEVGPIPTGLANDLEVEARMQRCLDDVLRACRQQSSRLSDQLSSLTLSH